MIYTNFTDYFRALNHYLNTPFSIVNGEGFATVKGERVSSEIYWANNSRPLYQAVEKENPDKKNISNEVKIKSSRR